MDYFFSPDFIAGCVAGSIGIVVTQPMDTIRIRMQVQAGGSMKHHFLQVFKSEGMRGLFRGVGSPTLTVGLMSAVLFHSFEMSKVWIIDFQHSQIYHNLSSRFRHHRYHHHTPSYTNNENNIISTTNTNTNTNTDGSFPMSSSSSSSSSDPNEIIKQLSNIIDDNNTSSYIHYKKPNYLAIWGAGCFSGAVSCLITAPTELMKCIVQDSTRKGTATIKQEFKEIGYLYKEYGLFKGVYRGLSMTMARDMPAFSIYFLLYEYISNRFDPTKQSTMVAFGGGFVAGLCSWASVYPIDVIKTHYQLRKLEYAKLPLHKAVQHHVKLKGIHSLFSGLSATVWRAGPQHAVVFVCYEWVKRRMFEMNGMYYDDDEDDSELSIAIAASTQIQSPPITDEITNQIQNQITPPTPPTPPSTSINSNPIYPQSQPPPSSQGQSQQDDDSLHR